MYRCLISSSINATGYLKVKTASNFGPNYRIEIAKSFSLTSKISVGNLTQKRIYLAHESISWKRISTRCQKAVKRLLGRHWNAFLKIETFRILDVLIFKRNFLCFRLYLVKCCFDAVFYVLLFFLCFKFLQMCVPKISV